jgi:hypothetical protein
MTESLSDVFAAVSRQLAASLEQMQNSQARRRHRWNEDIMLMRDMFHLEGRRNHEGMSLTYVVTSLFLEGMGDIASQRVLAVYLPMLETLQRVELDAARVPGYGIWPPDDIRMYTGNLRRVDGLS